MSEEPRDAFVAFITIDDDEILLNFGIGDHTCERWRITEEMLRVIVMDALPRLLEK